MFKTNTRWLRPPELPTGPREPPPPPEAPRIEVWHDYSGCTSAAFACSEQGEADGPSGEWRRREPGTVYQRRNGSR